MDDDELRLEAAPQHDRLLQRFVGIGTAVQSDQQAREHTRLGQYRETFEIAQPEAQQFACHGQSSSQNVVSSARFEPLSHHDIFGPAPPERYPQMVTHRAFQRIERVGSQGAVFRDRRHALTTP